MHVNDAGLELIKSFEQLRLEAYQDLRGIWTIGYGHTPAQKGQRITEAEALSLLQQDVAKAEQGIAAAVRVTVSGNEFSALVSLAFNCGVAAITGSTLMRKLNAGDRAGAADEFLRWDHAEGQEVAGLLRRRRAERELFLRPDRSLALAREEA